MKTLGIAGLILAVGCLFLSCGALPTNLNFVGGAEPCLGRIADPAPCPLGAGSGGGTCGFNEYRDKYHPLIEQWVAVPAVDYNCSDYQYWGGDGIGWVNCPPKRSWKDGSNGMCTVIWWYEL